MSRVGKEPVKIPAGVEIRIENKNIIVKGSKGELNRQIPDNISVEKKDEQIIVKRQSDQPEEKSLHGLIRSLINNMVIGVSQGFEKKLELVGVGYRANKKGNNLELLVGYSKPTLIQQVEGIEFEVPTATKISIKGVDKEIVGQVASEIRAVRPPEPYKGKGIKYAGEQIRRKAGKTVKAGAGPGPGA